jgi:hypothetical protein
MILIVTHTQDYTVDFVANLLNRRNLPFLRLNTDRLLDYKYEVGLNGTLSFSINQIESFSGLWFRRVKYTEVSSGNKAVNVFLKLDYDALLFNMLAAYPFRFSLSNPYSVYQAENKLYQLIKAVEVGFAIPQTLVTNSLLKLTSFLDKYHAVVKPIRSGQILEEQGTSHIFTSSIQKKDIEGKDLTPCIFQNRIEKAFELRVTVVKDQIFCFKIDSQADPETALDWRKKPLRPEPYVLSEAISKKCIQLVRALGLSFGAIDLIVTTDDQIIFLEINPNGQWAWLELETGIPISSAIINYLYNGL